MIVSLRKNGLSSLFKEVRVFRVLLAKDPTYGDRWRLQPAYDVVASYIRKASPDRLIFFSGCTYDRTGRWVTKVMAHGDDIGGSFFTYSWSFFAYS